MKDPWAPFKLNPKFLVLDRTNFLYHEKWFSRLKQRTHANYTCFENISLKMMGARSLLSLKNSFARIFRFLMWIGTDLSISESFSKVIPSLWLKNNLKFLIVKWIWCQWCFVLQLISYPINGQWFGLGPLLKFVVNPTNLF